jgi:hypothetical protein
MGQALHSLVGYSARPTTIQLLFYGGTLGVLMMLIALIDGRMKRGTVAAVAAAGVMAAFLFVKPAFAIDKIYSPNVEKGEAEIEYNFSHTFDNDSDKDNAQAHELEFEYTPTDHWKTALVLEAEREPGEEIEMTATEWENVLSFWDQGEKWADAGVLLAYIHANHDADADALEAKLLLEKQAGKFVNRLNFGAEQEIGSNAAGGPDFSGNWSTHYRLNEHFEPGFEIQSDFGQDATLRHFNQQEHYIGPALSGEIVHNVKYEAALLFGVSDAAADTATRFKLEYEKYF